MCIFKKWLWGGSVYSGLESDKKLGNYGTKSDNALTDNIMQMLPVKLLSHQCAKFVAYVPCGRGNTILFLSRDIMWP